jgi:serine/threonine-protein kinase RsbT
MQGLTLGHTWESSRQEPINTPPTVRILICSDVDIVVARRQSKALATAMNFSSTDTAFIATTVSELARALLAHTTRGEILLHRIYESKRTGVVIVAWNPNGRDSGRCRSISDLALPEVYRLVDEFHIDSQKGEGTTITATKWCRRSQERQ